VNLNSTGTLNGKPPPARTYGKEAQPDASKQMSPWRHRTSRCTRLLFDGYLPPGTRILGRCPACGGAYRIEIPLDKKAKDTV